LEIPVSLVHTTYMELRARLMKNMWRQWNATNFVYEQYDSTTGKGLKAHPFTGWSALIVNIIAEKY
jgi:mannosyl-oligosaccharide glucosidase